MSVVLLTLVGDTVTQCSNVLLYQLLNVGRHFNLVPVSCLDRVNTMGELKATFLLSLEQHWG